MFGGLYVVNTPSYLKWVPQISLIRWAYEGLCINEFSDLTLTQDPRKSPRGFPGLSSAPSVYPGSKVLGTMGFSESSIKRTLVAQAGIIVFNYVFTCIVLMSQGKPRNNHSISSPIGGGGDASILASKYESRGHISIQSMSAADKSMIAKNVDEELMIAKSAADGSKIERSAAVKSMITKSAADDESIVEKSVAADESMVEKSADDESIVELSAADDESMVEKSADDDESMVEKSTADDESMVEESPADDESMVEESAADELIEEKSADDESMESTNADDESIQVDPSSVTTRLARGPSHTLSLVSPSASVNVIDHLHVPCPII